MATDIPESDWKAFRKLSAVALERLCERILKGVGRITTLEGKTYHARFLALYYFIDEQNNEMARAFDNPRRSSALFQLAAMASLDLVTAAELGAFTPETQSRVEALRKATKRAHGTKGA
jgi:hypothetical protein